MDITAVAQRRYSTKAYDPSRKLSQDQIDRLVTVLRLSPSSVNLQPWHFVLASSDEGKDKIADTLKGAFAYNEPKVRNASHVLVLCNRTRIDEAYLEQVLDQEDRDGRLKNADARTGQRNLRNGYVQLHQSQWQDLPTWTEKQTYLALGMLLLAAGVENIDATPIEGFDPAAVNSALGLSERGFGALVLVCLGYHAETDFNAALPKSRLAAEAVVTVI